jgi:4-hydroxybenzoate polyprenyltransferase
LKNSLKFIKKIFSGITKEFVYGGHLTALAASMVPLTIVAILSLPFDFKLIIIPYLIAQVIYTYNHYKEIKFDIESNPERMLHIQKKGKIINILLFVYSFILVLILFFTNTKTFLLVLFIVTGGILYTDHFKPITVKYFAGLKNVYTSFFWALLVFIIPLFYSLDFNISYLWFFLFVFTRALVNTSFCDVKDIKSDKERKLKTFAVVFGKRNLIFLLEIINILAFIPILFGVYNLNIPRISLYLGISVIIGLYFITHGYFLKEKNLRNLTYLLVDAESYFWPLLIIIRKLF